MLWHIIRRLEQVKNADNIGIATTLNDGADPIVNMAISENCLFYRGSESDVVCRYAEAAEIFGADIVVRVTADNPLLDIDQIENMLTKMEKDSELDYCYVSDCPLGTGAEAVRTTALLSAESKAKSPYQREHVTPFIKDNPEMFKIDSVKSEFANFADKTRLTVDTEEDYMLICELYQRLYIDGCIVSLRDAVNLLTSNPELIKINKHIKQKSMYECENIEVIAR